MGEAEEKVAKEVRVVFRKHVRLVITADSQRIPQDSDDIRSQRKLVGDFSGTAHMLHKSSLLQVAHLPGKIRATRKPNWGLPLSGKCQ